MTSDHIPPAAPTTSEGIAAEAAQLREFMDEPETPHVRRMQTRAHGVTIRNMLSRLLQRRDRT